MDENVLRLSRTWNNVEQDVGQEQTWVQTSPYRSMLMPNGERSWLRLDDGFVQHQQPFWCEIPHDLHVGPACAAAAATAQVQAQKYRRCCQGMLQLER
eukprot:4445921-Amphidinium_carterae.1